MTSLSGNAWPHAGREATAAGIPAAVPNGHVPGRAARTGRRYSEMVKSAAHSWAPQ